jgi:PAS domain S-box-containing protein
MKNTRQTFTRLINSIGTKIIVPYVFLTIVVAGIGAFIVTNLVTGTLQERFDNQLIDSGRVVAEIMVDYEQNRLAVLRAVTETQGVSEGLKTRDIDRLETLVPQIIANSRTDAVIFLDIKGLEIYRWFKNQNSSNSKTDFAQLEEVNLVLNGFVDDAGNRRVVLSETSDGHMLFTTGPIFLEGEQIGAVLIGTSISKMISDLTENAIARVTLYEPTGNVIETSISAGEYEIGSVLKENFDWYKFVAENAHNKVPTRRIDILNQTYVLAYGDWRLRGQSFGMYSVALPSNFIINAAATSRNLLSLVFSFATVGVFAIGYVVSQRIVSPLDKLVQTTTAVTQGDLDKRSGIDRSDEIGVLAKSFDSMTNTLELRNQQLMEQASNLNAILQSIADGVIVLDNNDHILSANPAAIQILNDLSGPTTSNEVIDTNQYGDQTAIQEWLEQLRTNLQTQRYQVGNRVFSALSAPVITPGGDQSGLVIVLRDITREVEAEERQNSFITNVSHELRTPLTSIKGYSSLMLATGEDNFDEQYHQFIEIIDTNTNTLITHVNRLMEIAEIQDGTLKFDKKPISFKQIADKAAYLWKETIDSKNIIYKIESGKSNLLISGDGPRLAWAIDNLLQNACEYTAEGGQIQVKILEEDGKAQLSISDTGIGINATDQPFIFDRFFRVENEVNIHTPGMGLGLFIVQFIIQGHNGSITVESKPDQGSTFKVRIPLIENA